MTTLEFQTQIQSLLPQVEERMRAQAEGYHPLIHSALDQLLSSGGKRVRPTVILLVCGMLGVNENDAINLGASVELLHTATLVHDDLIDGATTRRGTPTLNATIKAPATILAGDFLFSQAAWLGAQVESNEVMRMFARTLSTIVNGEIVQIFARNAITTRADYDKRIYAKTASMFELAASAPAHLVAEGDRYFEPLRTYGKSIGMAFQMVDDILDFSSDAATLGKPVASDLRLGLVTLPSLIYLEANPNDARLTTLQNGETLDEATMESLLADIRSGGAMQQAHDEAEAQIQTALDALSKLPASPEREALADLASYVVERLH
jgi:geranylgeranyl pyrophosphate synthase